MVRRSAARISLALAALAAPGAQLAGAAAAAETCAAGGCAEEEADASALLAAGVRVHSPKAQREQLRWMRGDDIVPVLPPEEVSPPPCSSKPLPTPLPAPNPKDNPFVNGYVPKDCQNVTWPFFNTASGTWINQKGTDGQNFIALPQGEAPGHFIVQVNRYSEKLTYATIGGPVLNRGYLWGNQIQQTITNNSDQVFTGLLYEQEVEDLDLGAEIHKENGQILHQACRPRSADITDGWEVARLGAIPHGSQPMGFGGLSIVNCPDARFYVQTLLKVRESYEYSVQPWVPGCGPKFEQQSMPGTNNGPLGGEFQNQMGCCIGGQGYMKGQYKCPDTGCPEPIDTLIEAVKDLHVVKYVQLNMTSENVLPAVPLAGDFEYGMRGGGMQNTPFVNIHAHATPRSFKNLIWLLTVRRRDGSKYEMLQYIQTVDLKFLAKDGMCPQQLWPHVDANTLYRQ